MHCMLTARWLVALSVLLSTQRSTNSIWECSSTLCVGMAWGVSLSLYINWFRSKFQHTLKTDERMCQQYRQIELWVNSTLLK